MANQLDLKDLLAELRPEELSPRLEMQILVDPMGLINLAANNCCRDGGNCEAIDCDNNCRDGGNCQLQTAGQPLLRRLD